ncbi:MAG: helix-turn-helix transcriptional regulator [Prevotella sp.]|nr:helix-turn-helix transcriptional regulator [Prevotella sp.]
MKDGMITISELGPRIRMVREKFGISQKELADAIEINTSIMSKFENGGMVYARVLLDVMDYFRDKVNLNYLLQPSDDFSLDDPRAFCATNEQMNALVKETVETEKRNMEEILSRAYQDIQASIDRAAKMCMSEG